MEYQINFTIFAVENTGVLIIITFKVVIITFKKLVHKCVLLLNRENSTLYGGVNYMSDQETINV